jgi:hypothetical protein
MRKSDTPSNQDWMRKKERGKEKKESTNERKRTGGDTLDEESSCSVPRADIKAVHVICNGQTMLVDLPVRVE